MSNVHAWTVPYNTSTLLHFSLFTHEEQKNGQFGGWLHRTTKTNDVCGSVMRYYCANLWCFDVCIVNSLLTTTKVWWWDWMVMRHMTTPPLLLRGRSLAAFLLIFLIKWVCLFLLLLLIGEEHFAICILWSYRSFNR